MKIIDPRTSRESQAYEEPATPPTKPKKSTQKAKTSRKRTSGPVSARQTARELAKEKYGVEKRPALTPAERQQKRRSRLVGVHIELEPDQAAKLIALAEAAETNQTAVIRNFIDQAEL